MEGDRGAGEPGTESAGSRNYLGAESGSRNQKGTRLLFITAYHPDKNQFFHLTRRKVKFYKQENVIYFSGLK